MPREWRPFLSNPETRVSHLGLLIVTVILLATSLAILIWTIIRCGGITACSAEEPPQVQMKWKSKADVYGPPKYTVMDTQLVDAFSNGYHWIGQNQSIMSEDGRFELGLTSEGEAVFYDYDISDTTPYWRSYTANATSPGTKFVVGTNGLCYILRNDGSRVYANPPTQPTSCCFGADIPCDNSVVPPCFWQSPNQFQSYFRCPDGSTFYVNHPFILTFYNNGLYLYSDNTYNGTRYHLSSNRIPIWWIDVTKGAPPGAFPLAHPDQPFPSNNPSCTANI